MAEQFQKNKSSCHRYVKPLVDKCDLNTHLCFGKDAGIIGSAYCGLSQPARWPLIQIEVYGCGAKKVWEYL